MWHTTNIFFSTNKIMVFSKRSFKKSGTKRSFKKRTFSKRPMKRTKAVSKLATTVKRNTSKLDRVAQIVDTTTGTHTYRKQSTTQLPCQFGNTGVLSLTGNSKPVTEATLERLQYFNAASPAFLVEANGNNGDYMREFLFTKLSTKLTIVNQGFLTANVKIYRCYPKQDTNIRPEIAWENGLANQLLDFTSSNPALGPSVRNILSRPTDSEQFNDLWRTEKFETIRLQPGGRYTASENLGSFKYDPSLFDNHSQAFQKRINTMMWMIVVVGDVAENDVQGNINTTNLKQLILTHEETFEIKYDAGISLNTLEYVPTGYNILSNAYNAQKPNAQQRDSVGNTQP